MGIYRNNGKQVLFDNGDGVVTHIADARDNEASHALATAMNQRSESFITNSLRTKSPNFYGHRVSRQNFTRALNAAIDAANQLDKIKKSLFYGRDNNLDPAEGLQDTSDIPARMGCDNNPMLAIDIVHGIIGKFTEAGELLEALKASLNGEPLDLVNVAEEIGDGFWYDAILLNRASLSFEEVQTVIINKLRARFPEAYSDDNANLRDLDTERAILERATIAPTNPASGGEAVRNVAAGADAAFKKIAAAQSDMIDAPATSGTAGGELHKSPAERQHPLPGEHLAHQRIRREDRDS